MEEYQCEDIQSCMALLAFPVDTGERVWSAGCLGPFPPQSPPGGLGLGVACWSRHASKI